MAEIEHARLSLAGLKPHPRVARTRRDGKKTGRLSGSIKKDGQINEFIVGPDRETVVNGWGRVLALQEAGEEFGNAKILDHLPSDFKLKVMNFVENQLREGLSGYDQWVTATDCLSMKPDMTGKELAAEFNVTPGMICRILAPSFCPVETQDALKADLIGLSDCYAIKKAKTPERQAAMLAMKLSGMGRDDLEEEGRRVRARSKPAVKVSRAKLILSSGISIVVSGAEICLETVIEALSDVAKQARRAREENQDIKAFALILKNKAKKGAAS
ncbi:MAG TPA: ParB/RepB/Spo0J family partition protein [Pirellulales bacterium]|jgi:hypothetical protein|nr:ParB/RepB/Spo0J family partition protein [Pirellulales bacterium]